MSRLHISNIYDYNLWLVWLFCDIYYASVISCDCVAVIYNIISLLLSKVYKRKIRKPKL